MSPRPVPPSDPEDRLVDVILAYLEAEDAGQSPDRRAALERHPDVAPELAAFFAATGALAPLLEPLRTGADGAASTRERSPSAWGRETTAWDPARDAPGANAATATASLDTPPPVPSVALPPRQPSVPGYEVLEVLGKGGMGIVYKARQESLNRLVALKVLLAPEFHDTGQLARFRNEAEAIARLQHPHILQVFDSGAHDRLPYLVLEYAEGGTLAQRLRTDPPPPREASRLIETLARAVHAIHQCGLVHRDLKPSNILLTRDGWPKVADFGLARLRDGATGDTATGAIVGSAGYMAPEQAQGRTREVGPPADVWALGAILYELLTGRPPFLGATFTDTLLQIIAEEPAPPRRLRPEVPPALEAICLRCLRKPSAERYPSADALADDLARFLREDSAAVATASGFGVAAAEPGRETLTPVQRLEPGADREADVRSPSIRRRRLAILAACLACLSLGWALINAFQPSRQSIEGNPAPAQAAAPLSAFQHLTLRVDRDNKRFVPKTQEDLERLLPFRAGDKLGITASVPAGMHVGLFTLTLTDPRLDVRQLELQPSGDKLLLPGVVPLEGSPATELLFLCGSPGPAPGPGEVAALVQPLHAILAAGDGKPLLLPDNVLLSVQTDKVDDAHRGRVGAVQADPVLQVAARLEQVRAALRERFAFVAGVAFTHVAVAGQAQRGNLVPPDKKAGPEDWGGSEEDRKLFQQVMDRLLQTDQVRKNFPAQYAWPPKVYIQPRSAKTFNAFAGPYGKDAAGDKILVRAFITEGYLNKIIQDDDDILAAIMGHELAHLTKGHLANRIKMELTDLALSRQQEIEADLEGVKIAVAAGFAYKSGIRSAFREWKALGDFSNFEGVRATHPSWAERLQFLDQKQADLWKAMAAFQNGYFFLHAEQYRTAEACFQSVVEDFPDCAEAWANLGYARLMQYCDGLELADMRKLGIGQFVAGCFYARPQGLVPARGDEVKWKLAVQALEVALRRDPNLVLARANLGLAHLVHVDEQKTDLAVELFQEAAKHQDKGLDRLNVPAFLINFGVAELARKQPEAAADKFRLARKVLSPAPGLPLVSQLDSALGYNEALLAAASPDQEARAQAFRGLERYLGPGQSRCPLVGPGL
jgi:tRNA A-37 threonylcarbamoyl transferase component Bud32/tetratricopeptide (TPR) repeat protein